MSDSLRLDGLLSTRLPCPWNSPGKNSGVGSHSLNQEIFLTQWSNPDLLHCRWILYSLSHQRSPMDCKETKPVNPKGNQPGIFIGRTDAEAPILWPPDAKSWLIGKDPDAGKEEGKRRRGWQSMKWLDSITDSVDMNLSKLQEIVKDRKAWRAAVHGVAKNYFTTIALLTFFLDDHWYQWGITVSCNYCTIVNFSFYVCYCLYS